MPNPACASALSRLLWTGEPKKRVGIARAVGRLQPGDEGVVKLLGYFAGHSGDGEVEEAAIGALGEMGETSGRAALALIELIADGTSFNRDLAAGLLMQRFLNHTIVGAAITEATVEKLVRALADCQVGAAAEHVLRTSRALDGGTILRLSDAFRHLDDDPLRVERFDDLDDEAVRLAVPALAGLLRDGPASIIGNVARALCRVDRSRASAALARGEYDVDALEEAEFRAILGE